MSDHDKFAKTAQRLISKHGRTMTFSKPGQKVLKDADRPHLGHVQGDPVKKDLKALVLEFRDTPDNAQKREMKMKRLLVAAGQGVDLLDYTTVIDGAILYSVTLMDVLKPGDQEILYKGEVKST